MYYLKKLIENYNPHKEQEIIDRQTFLMYLRTFDDVVTRKNGIAHFTASAFVVNKEKTKVLMIHHNIYNSWSWPGGHADGKIDLLAVAIREIEEETGIKNVKVLNKGGVISIDTLPVLGHFKNGKYVPAHVHLSVAFLLEANENDPIKTKPDENSDVKWININEVVEASTEPHMKFVYNKIILEINRSK